MEIRVKNKNHFFPDNSHRSNWKRTEIVAVSLKGVAIVLHVIDQS